VEESPVLAGIVGASVQGRVALGPRAGARVRRLGHEPGAEALTSQGPRQSHLEGFDLHANVWVSANDRAGLERRWAAPALRSTCGLSPARAGSSTRRRWRRPWSFTSVRV